MHIAVVNDKFDSVRRLVEGYSELVNVKELINGLTPVMLAAKLGFTDIAIFLMQRHDCIIGTLDLQQNSALHWAAYGGSVSVLSKLLLRGSLIDAKNMLGQTPL